MPRLDAIVTSMLLTLQPVGTVILALVLLSEDPSSVQLLGIAVLLGGVALATTRQASRVPT
ncbi:MAG: EamA family transporter [Gaiellaceae bacterium]